ncbi:precorrin-3B C(17)-methyltransferase [Amycolatopsis sp. FBCC-B4732]|uniref:SecDF P1 head subdomain-containing protein n=1 Tax=Amycolatopsis sp. FBCC-B4732 TaxID=3079339 RepID=UPI001FF530CB|nr:precorrin-3B C(17)-methyltransferase [Amycolatopsis sp. FBCC-B4732]UOX90306.1 precorrin-3B C(17)-methyltransferase [Amycolatopsis sp. FBCC-B4732]
MRILLLAAVAVLATGCSPGIAGHAVPKGFVVKDGSVLRFRPVLTEAPPGPAAGAAAERQSTDPAAQQAALLGFDCAQGKPDPLDGRDDPALPLVSCDRAQGTKYVLGPGFLSGADVSRVDAVADPATGSPVITLSFTAKGAKTWAEWTGQNVGKQVAMVLKSRVLTAPSVQSAITGGETQISGRFTLPEARQLAKDIAGG